MPLPVFTAQDFLRVLQQLSPRGRVWPKEPDAVATRVLSALTPGYARLAARDNNLVVDGFPGTAVELLPEWEAATGLPDPCLGPSPTIEQRQAQLKARLALKGGADRPMMEAYCAALGYPATITEYIPARFGIAHFGDRWFGEAWSAAWNVACDPAGVTLLSCELNRIKPLQTRLLFNANI